MQHNLGLLNVESDMRYAEWLEQWYSSFLNVKENTLVRYREDLDLYIKPMLGKKNSVSYGQFIFRSSIIVC